jgi:CheY-like chemotaxis protein
MPVKILLADKSITIQKVVEMLFSGKDYEVLCVSDGETALSEAARVAPDVVLADIDLPRIDGYAFSGRLKQEPALARTPVILMLSRDDVFDQAKARQVSIVDHIAKPFESQELIGKVKKAVSGGTARPAETAAAAAPQTAAARPQPAAPPKPPAAAPKPAKKAEAPDIFDIIEDAPTQEDIKRPSPPKVEDEGVYEVEPVVEYEEQFPRDTAKALPVGKKAVEEMREGLGLSGGEQTTDDIVSFESLDMATAAAREYVPPQQQEKPAPPSGKQAPAAAAPSVSQPVISESDIWTMAEATVAKIAKEMLGTMQLKAPADMPAPTVPEAMVQESVQRAVREMAGEIIEKVAWEVVPDLAAAMIRAEIERLKAEP